MERFELKTYDNTEDRSPLYCGGGAILIGALAWREYSTSGELGLRFCLMMVVMVVFAVVAVLLMQRHRITIEVRDNSEGEGELKIPRREGPGQVILQSQLAFVKLEKDRVMIHYYEGEDLRRTSIPSKGARKKKVAELVEVLEKWQV